MRKSLVAGLGVAIVAGCHAPLMPGPAPLAPAAGLPTGSVSTAADQGRVAVTIQWPYRTQVIPTSTERLRFTLSGPASKTLDLDRPYGAAPISTASLQVDVGTGYTLAVAAYAKQSPSDFEPSKLVASGQSDPFDVLVNKVSGVRVALTPNYVPSITGFTPTNGGPGSYVSVFGTGFGATSQELIFRFGGTPASNVYQYGDGTASVRVPDGATSSALVPVVDGVPGLASGSFTVLSSLGITPSTQSVASGNSYVFTAEATSSEGSPFVNPAVVWALSTDSVGTIAQDGEFTAIGTGTVELQIWSGNLLATASVTVP
ncbi:MAG TPA: IPT/TIG domain-containing protein [Stenomitos sp.]